MHACLRLWILRGHAHLLAGEHQGPMRFEAKNCSKWHFSPVSCMSGESKGGVEPELKAVEDDKDQGAKERLLDKR